MKDMKIRDKNPVLKGLIQDLLEASEKNKVSVWKAVAEGLNRPRKKAYEITLKNIEQTARKKETVVVPGTVLSRGNLKKKLTVAALRFSAGAEEKIRKAGGKAVSIRDILKDSPKGKNVRIMG